MIKAQAKSAPATSTLAGAILYCETDSSVLAAQSKMFVQAGYKVDRAVGRAAVVQALQQGSYDVVVLGHTLSKDDRHHLAYMVKKASRDTQVMVLHASGKHPAVDIALDSRDGEKAILAALNTLGQRKLLMAS
jgi:DNA-binding NtrC family response regulator